MDSEMTQPDHHQQLSLELTREILQEVCQVTRDSEQQELFEFARLLAHVADLAEGDDEESLRFIRDGLSEIHRLVVADQPSSEHLDWLRSEAINRWGDLSATSDEMDPFSCEHHAAGWGSNEEHEEVNGMEDLVAPSAEELSSLLGRFGSGSVLNPSSERDEQGDRFADSQRVEVSTACPIVGLSDDSLRDAGDAGDASVSIAKLDPELREAFLDDASSCVSSMEESMLKLDRDAGDVEALNQICRELHTLKGASASVGLSVLASQIHELEDRLRDDQSAGRAPQVDELLKSVDSIRMQISGGDAPKTSEQASDSEAHSVSDAQASLPTLADFTDGPNDDEMVRVKSSQLNRLMDMLAELVMLRNRRETELSDLQEVYHELIGSVSKMRLLSNEGSVVSNACTSLQLSEVANDVLEVAQHVRDCSRPVAEGNTAVSQFIRQFRQELVALRRTPVSGLFRRLQRVVRDAANAEDKEVRLQLVGEDAGIERSLQQRLYEPLLHIVRNSVCHGIEHPEERTRNRKPASGTITLEARSGPDLFVIEIRDDGRGLDYDAIRRRGVESGLLASDQVASREELSQLIFHPGFSTRQTASRVAGRGVGMDVVATTIQRMRGWLEIDSEPNRGTRIRLSFPLPSVIQHAMVFRSGGQLFALPMQSVRSAGEADRGATCLSLSELLGCPQAESSQHILLAAESTTGQAGAVGSSRVSLLVDEVIGPEEVVVRPLPALLRQHPFCSGATLSGMGQTVLFLDARRLTESFNLGTTQSDVPGETAGTTSGQTSRSRSQRLRVLVVDDSLSARKRVVRSLRRYVLDVVEASDGRQALEVLKKQHFDAIFSDMEMPHVSGMELLEELNSGDRPDRPPVVIISSRNETEFTSRAKELGANNYLFKPLSDEALDHALSGIAALRQLETESMKPLQMSGETHDR